MTEHPITQQPVVTNIPVKQIVRGNNDRKRFDSAKLKRLAESIRKNGFKGAIVLRDLGNGTYRIVAGERRFRAVTEILGWETIPAFVYVMDDEEESAMMLAENTSREDLDPIEEAAAYQSRIDQFGWSPELIAEKAGVKLDRVKRRLPLLKLVEEIQELVAFGHFPLGHAEVITDLDSNRQRIALRIFNTTKKGMFLTSFRELVSDLLEEQNQQTLFDLESFWVQRVQTEATLIKRGKKAITGAPTRSDIPQPRILGSKDTAANIFDRYIADLLSAGKVAEAGALGNLYNALVTSNYLSVPEQAELLTKAS